MRLRWTQLKSNTRTGVRVILIKINIYIDATHSLRSYYIHIIMDCYSLETHVKLLVLCINKKLYPKFKTITK